MSHRYIEKAGQIKLRLRRYTDQSFINALYEYFNASLDNYSFLEKRPWCCFLALKWKLLEPRETYERDISKKEFIGIINLVFDLQSEAGIFEPDKSLDLSMRKFISNQIYFQESKFSSVYSLLRQHYIFCQGDNEYYEREFFKATGLPLDSYYKISLTIISRWCSNSGTESFRIPLSDFIVKLHPQFPIEDISKYLKLTGIKTSNIKRLFEDFDRPGSPTWEYFEDTPLKESPFIINFDYIYVFSKRLTVLSLTDLVPDLLKRKTNGAFKQEFGPDLERYVEKLILEFTSNYLNERAIEQKLHESSMPKDGLIADFYIFEHQGAVFIDSKAIEPNSFVKTVDSPEQLEKRLRDSFIKGVLQLQDTARRLEECGAYKRQPMDCGLVVVHKDFLISTATKVKSNIDPGLEEKIVNKSGKVYIKLDRIYFVTIEDLEKMAGYCRDSESTICSLIQKFCDDDKDNMTSSISTRGHIGRLLEGKLDFNSYLKKSCVDIYSSIIIESNKNSVRWNGEIGYMFDCLNALREEFENNS